MSDRNLLLEIVDALEAQGLDRDAYQLHRVIDIEALEQLVDSASDDLEVRFAVGAFCVLVTRTEVRVIARS
ncbi:HalOD1 output domain-containing protein [Natrinema amylolyticum]|uniref:HalOD1 output domain-containing protein n=1 Tax=Natrinema amylolyticum TaxID=2878679 RepID=UPI001CF9F5F6|nr:HalOD1 output domain-containing protein [Natrinema amylolyticum]